MQRYLDAAMSGDWDTGFGFFADDIALHVPGRSEFAASTAASRSQSTTSSRLGLTRGRRGGTRADRHAGQRGARGAPGARALHREDGVVEIRRANVYRVQGEKIVEIWIFEADQYAVDELLG